MIRTLILVGIGGGLGSILRYLTSLWATKYFQSVFPLATFTANVLGCLFIGILLGLFERQQLTDPDLKFLLIIGFCGGYTTFSSFAAENINLLQNGHLSTFFLYSIASFVTSLVAVWLGLLLTR